METPRPRWKLKLLFDGACPFCRLEARVLGRRNRGGALVFEDIAAPGFEAGRYGLTTGQVDAFIHGVLPDGTVVRGLEVFRRAYTAVGLGWLLAPTAWPGLRRVFDAAYRAFARNRVRLGTIFGRGCADGACGLPTRTATGSRRRPPTSPPAPA
jgi:predicted DCC family thiol-disulfide oxidoreductase YuxK